MDNAAQSIAMTVAIIAASTSFLGVIIGLVGALVLERWKQKGALALEKQKQEYETSKQIRQHGYEREKEAKKLKGEKLEELVSMMYEITNVIYFSGTPNVMNLLIPLIAKVDAINTIYFNEFREPSNQMNIKLFDYMKAKADNLDHNKAEAEYLKVVAPFMKLLREYAEREFQ